jgi:hypothetical protein
MMIPRTPLIPITVSIASTTTSVAAPHLILMNWFQSTLPAVQWFAAVLGGVAALIGILSSIKKYHRGK